MFSSFFQFSSNNKDCSRNKFFFPKLIHNLTNLVSHLYQQFHTFHLSLIDFHSNLPKKNSCINDQKKNNLISSFKSFRFKFNLWLFIIVIFLNFYLHSFQTIEELNNLCVNRGYNWKLLSPNSCKNTKNIKIGYLTNYNSSTNQRLGLTDVGAIYYAVSQVNELKILGDRKLELITSDTCANPVRSTASMLYQWDKGVVAFIGPDNTCVTEATVAAALNLPMISYKCSDHKVSDKKIYHTFARTVAPDTGIVNSVLSLLQYHNWYQFSLIYKDKENFRKVAENLIEKSSPKFKVEPRRHYPDVSECCSSNSQCCKFTFKEIIEETAKQTRIWVFIGDRKEVQDFMKLFKNYNYHLNSHFVIIVDTTDWDESIYTRYLTDNMEEELKNAYKASMIITFSPPNRKKYKDFVAKIREANSKLNIQQNNLKTFITLYACYLYDAVWLYANALARALHRDNCANNGTDIINEVIMSNNYTSICGSYMEIDENGDILGNYTVFGYKNRPADLDDIYSDKYSKLFIPIGMFRNNKQNFSSLANSKDFISSLTYEPIENITVDWINNVRPVDRPKCGFDNSLCKQDDFRKKVFAVLAVLKIILVFLTIFIYRSYRHEQEIQGLLWNIKIIKSFEDDIPSYTSSMYGSKANFNTNLPKRFTQTVDYHGRIVAVKQLNFYHKYELSMDMKREMSVIKNLHHDNLIQFIGADLEHLSPLNCIYLVTEYCDKGSLQDVLAEEKFPLGTIITASFIFDLLSALSYLHKSDIKFHGNLKSSNCLITSRIVLKVSDFGLHSLRLNSKKFEKPCYLDLLWKPPEQLREDHFNKHFNIKDSSYVSRMQKGDIYSFAIILHEIIVREGPFNIRKKVENDNFIKLTPKDIIENLKRETNFVSLNSLSSSYEIIRPKIPDEKCETYISETMRECWCEIPEKRLDIATIKTKLKSLQDALESNVMNDTNTLLLTNYNENLELLVNRRTMQVISLLQRMLPNSAAQQLMDGKTVEPEYFDSVTIFFSDIVEFTTIAAKSEPRQIVDFLNNLYTLFDEIIKHYDVYKVETIGDAYMVGSGFPEKNGDRHVKEIANMALELLESTKTFEIKHQPNQKLQLRIGIHSGPICAGVVGKTMPRYCVFGDTVNYANRMESTGQASKIHVSEQAKLKLEKFGNYLFECRGNTFLKGIGDQTTYWLIKNTNPNERQYKLNSSKDALLLKKRNKSENNFQRRSSGVALRETHTESSIDFGIMQNAIKSNKNLISCDDSIIDSIIPENDLYSKVSQSQSCLYNSYLEFPNTFSSNMNSTENFKIKRKIYLNGKTNSYDKDNLIIFNDLEQSQKLIKEDFNDNFENSLDYSSCFYIDNYSKNYLRKVDDLGKPYFQKNFCSIEKLIKKSKSCTDLNTF